MLMVKQILITHINHSKHLIPEGIHCFKGMEENSSDLAFFILSTGCVRWCHFYVLGMTQQEIELATSYT